MIIYTLSKVEGRMGLGVCPGAIEIGPWVGTIWRWAIVLAGSTRDELLTIQRRGDTLPYTYFDVQYHPKPVTWTTRCVPAVISGRPVYLRSGTFTGRVLVYPYQHPYVLR